MFERLPLVLLLAVVLIAVRTGPGTCEESLGLSVAWERQGPAAGDVRTLAVSADGKVRLRATLKVGLRTAKFEKDFTLHPQALAAFRTDLERLKALDLPALPDPPAGATVVASLNLKGADRSLQRGYSLVHFQKEIPDLRVIKYVELYSGLTYWFGDHLLRAGEALADSGKTEEALPFFDAAAAEIGTPYPDDDPWIYLDKAGERIIAARAEVKKGQELPKALSLYRSGIHRLRRCYYAFLDGRGLLPVTEVAEQDGRAEPSDRMNRR